MPAVSAAFVVGTTAVLLTSSGGGSYKSPYLVKNNHATQVVYLGGSDVTVANGMPLAAGESKEFLVDNELDELYAISAAAGGDVRVLRTQYRD